MTILTRSPGPTSNGLLNNKNLKAHLPGLLVFNNKQVINSEQELPTFLCSAVLLVLYLSVFLLLHPLSSIFGLGCTRRRTCVFLGNTCTGV